MKKLFGLLLNRYVLAVLGFLVLALLIWFVGPLLAIAEFRPLESPTARLILIAALLGIQIARAAWRFFKARRQNARLMEDLLAGQPQAGAPAPGEEEVALLRKRFEEAVTLLKRTRLQAQAGSFAAVWARFGRRYVYELPWYVLIGAPGSGKTTALVNSGLRFPLAEQTGQHSVRGVGGTRNCDWWFTDEAVLLDTAGRYTTQESDKDADSAAWGGFLDLLKRYRPRRPVNGVVLTVSVADLLRQSRAQRELHAAQLRARIQEIYERLGVRVPIYVLVTKVDLLAGFMEFFAEFGAEERAQVWGVTFPYIDGADAVLSPLAAELDTLEQRLNERLLDRLEQEHDPARRSQIYLFPQQFASIKGVLADFLGSVFAPSSYAITPLCRGVYFTSGTQEGSPIDRVIGVLSRGFRLENRVLAPQRPSGKSFFITRLIRDVLFAECDLAGTNLAWERRRAVLKWGCFALAGLFSLGCLLAWTISYSRNQAYLDQVDANAAAVAKRVQTAAGGADVVQLLPVLTAVQQSAYTDVVRPDHVPLSLRWGLYQGDKLQAASDLAYRRLLRDALLPRIGQRLEHMVQTTGYDRPELLYEALKAYLMLSDSGHFNAAEFKAFVRADWDANLPSAVGTDERAALNRHLERLYEHGQPQSPLLQNAAMVATARTAVASTPTARRIYNRIRRVGLGEGLPEFTVAGAVGAPAALVFDRRSGQPLSRGVPGLFSVEGYRRFVKESEAITRKLVQEESWVLGQTGVTGARAEAQLLDEVRRLYLEDYAATWEAFIQDIRLVQGGGRKQSLTAVSLLSAPDSPLPKLLRAIVEQVTLVKKDAAQKNLIERGEDTVESTALALRKLVGQDKPPTPTAEVALRPESIVDDRFDALRRLVSAPPGQAAPIDATTALLKELYVQMTAADAAIQGGNPPPPSDVPTRAKVEAGLSPEPVRSMLLSISSTAESQALAGLKENVSQSLGASIGEFCNQAIAGRYPFAKGSARDVTQDDFARLFAPGGLMDDFFQKNLATLVDTSTSPWTYRKLSDQPLSDGSGALAQFERAQVIRDVFFRSGGHVPGLRLDFKPLEMDAGITQFILDVDGQLVQYSHGPQVMTPVQWPGPRGSTQVRVQLSPPSASGASGQVFEGPWALFRLFDRARVEATGQPERFLATFNVDGRKARFEIRASSVQNPFRLPELDRFQCPSRL